MPSGESVAQAKAEKGLEPVAQVEMIEETSNEFPIEFRQQVRDAMNNAWVGGYNECVDHPPTQVEPVAWMKPGNSANFVTFNRMLAEQEGYTPLYAHPPTSEWNAAEVADLIEALWRGDEGADADAARLIGRLTGVTTEHLPASALKREPR